MPMRRFMVSDHTGSVRTRRARRSWPAGWPFGPGRRRLARMSSRNSQRGRFTGALGPRRFRKSAKVSYWRRPPAFHQPRSTWPCIQRYSQPTTSRLVKKLT